MRHKDEYMLLQKVSNGDAAAFRMVYEHYAPPVYSFIRKYLHSSELSDDICQNVFIKIWEQREQLSSVLEFGAYVLTIAKRQSLDLLKRASREHIAMNAILQGCPCPTNQVEYYQQEREYMLFIEKTLKAMPPQTRMVFELCRQQGKSYDEAAAELGIGRNAIKKHMVRSMRVLKDAAEKELGISLSIILAFLSARY